MNKTKCIQYYLDSREYSSKEVLENIEETKKEFTKKKIHVEYRINDFGMYEITFFFENKITIFGKIKLYLKKKDTAVTSRSVCKSYSFSYVMHPMIRYRFVLPYSSESVWA